MLKSFLVGVDKVVLVAGCGLPVAGSAERTILAFGKLAVWEPATSNQQPETAISN